MTLAQLSSLPEGLFARCAASPQGVIALQRGEGGFVPMGAADFAEKVRRRARGLLRLGVKAGERVILMAPNSVDWALMDFAILSVGAVTVPLYPSFGAREIHYVLGDSGAGLVLLEGMAERERIGDGGVAWGVPADRLLLREGGAGTAGPGTWAGLEQLGEGVPAAELDGRLRSLRRDDLATLVYTSGTTGWPKGVMLSHGNILSNISGFLPLVPLRHGQRLLSILPLSHVFERGTGHFGAYLLGLEVAYAERPDTVLRDMALAQPHILIAVPRVFQLLYGRVRRGVEERRGFLGRLLRRGLGLEASRPPRGWQHYLARALLIRSLRAKLGGRLRFFVSGGAPLPEEIARFFLDLGLPIVEGYGMTEASPVIAANPLAAIRPGTVGRFLPNLEGRIAADGEILVRGPSIMAGYWNNETATREALADGWLHTGDVGSLDADGYLRITDRKKDLIVNSAGENIPPQKIEMRLTAQPLIAQAVVFGDRLPYLLALIVPNEELLTARLGPAASPTARREALRGVIQDALADLPSYEQVRRFALLDHPLSEAAGELTPTLKVKRNVVKEKYAAVLDALTAGGGRAG